jgi:hypothetical protein
MSLTFSALAIVVSVATFFLTFRASAVAERRQRMPVVVVARATKPGEHGHTFELTNVGGGPALNIVLAFAEDGPRTILHKGVAETWFDPLHLRPIRPGQTLTVHTPASTNGLGLRYTDALMQKTYTVKASHQGTCVYEGNHLPGWRIEAVPSMWDPDLPPSRWDTRTR